MGQRLNIEIIRKKDGKRLANAYYHWSAYTGSSLELAKIILNNANDILIKHYASEELNDTDKAILLLQSTGAGLEENEYSKLEEKKTKYFNVSIDRNMGLIAFSEDGMNDTEAWEEGRISVVVDFENKNYLQRSAYIDFQVFSSIDINEFTEYYENDFESKKEIEELFENSTSLNFDLDKMGLKDIYTFIGSLGTIENDYGIFENKGNYYQIIY